MNGDRHDTWRARWQLQPQVRRHTVLERGDPVAIDASNVTRVGCYKEHGLDGAFFTACLDGVLRAVTNGVADYLKGYTKAPTDGVDW